MGPTAFVCGRVGDRDTVDSCRGSGETAGQTSPSCLIVSSQKCERQIYGIGNVEIHKGTRNDLNTRSMVVFLTPRVTSCTFAHNTVACVTFTFAHCVCVLNVDLQSEHCLSDHSILKCYDHPLLSD